MNYFSAGGLKLFDVVVIGAGPVGSYAAYRLAEMGCKVVVLEQRDKLGGKVCCTGIIGQECVDSFAIDDNVILRRLNSAKLFSPSGGWLRLWRRESQACIIDRAAFDVALAERAQVKGAEYLLNSLAKDIEVRSDKVRIKVACQDRGLNLEAKAAIVATGFGSGLVERLGLGGVGDFIMGAQTEMEAKAIDEVEVYFGQEIAPGFFAWLVPISSNRVRLGLLSRRSPGLYLRKLMSSLQVQGRVVSADAELSYGGIPLKPLSRTYCDRVIVVGDAAGQVKPTTGGGIYYGLLCAEVAADTLHRALENNALSARSLAGYQREWKRKLGRELKLGYWARKFYERLNDQQIDKIFDIIRDNGIAEALLKAEDLSFDWHSEAVLRLLGYRAVSAALDLLKIPFRLTRGRVNV